MPKVNSEILVWARDTAGLTLDEAVGKLGIKEAKGVAAVDRLAALERGDLDPTRPMLVKMAKQYRRPLLTFYLRKKPLIGDRGEDYRTLPDTIGDFDVALVDAVVRDIHARQSLVQSVLINEDEAQPLAFVGSMTMGLGVPGAVTKLRKVLSFDSNIYRDFKEIDEAFKYLRRSAESAGVFVLLVDNLGSWHTTVPVEAFRGFALADSVAPFIAINANDSKGAWCFTLIHELVHIALGATGVSGLGFDAKIEKFCNDVASEFLLPESQLAGLQVSNETSFDQAKELIGQLSQEYNVSSTMIAYKLFRLGAIDYKRFDDLRIFFRREYLAFLERTREKNRKKKGGPTYQTLRKHRVGTTLIHLVDRMMYSGALTTTKAGAVLGVSAKNVHGVLESARPVFG